MLIHSKQFFLIITIFVDELICYRVKVFWIDRTVHKFIASVMTVNNSFAFKMNGVAVRWVGAVISCVRTRKLLENKKANEPLFYQQRQIVIGKCVRDTFI